MIPKISVIMPSLNVGKYIRESVCSVMRQTLKDIEILCIDAGSEDGTWEILQDLSKKDERICLYHSDIKSYGYQVNMGLRFAKGRYISIVETDDYVDAGMYEKLYQTAEKYDCDYVKSDYIFYWTQINKERYFSKKRIFMTDDLYNRVIEPGKCVQISSDDWYLWNGIYRRSFIRKYQIRLHETKGAAFQDIGFLHQTTIYAKRAFYLKDTFYRYCIDRFDSSSNSGKALEYACQEFQELIKEMKKDTENIKLRALYIRMSKSFVCCYSDAELQNVDTDRKKKNVCYIWFREQLGKAVNDQLISRRVIHSGIWDKLNILLVSEEHYYSHIQNHNNSLMQQLGDNQSCQVVIFGCGRYGYLACQWLEKRQYSVLSFMDNSSELWGKRINGILIRNPEEIPLLGKHVKYLVASTLYYQDIVKQLSESGIEKGRIAVFA